MEGRKKERPPKRKELILTEINKGCKWGWFGEGLSVLNILSLRCLLNIQVVRWSGQSGAQERPKPEI